MNSQQDIVIGIDGGGTYTRVMVSDLQGHILSYVEGGAASIHKNIHASQNVRRAIMDAVSQSGHQLNQVKGILAGIAGFDSEEDREWVEALTDLSGLSCPRWHVNDAVIAHAGAFLAEPGIVVISGTGSIIFAILEDGTQIRNYDLQHYAYSAARFLSYDAVFEILAGNGSQSDDTFIQQVLSHWEVSGLADLRELAIHKFINDRRERDRMFGAMAPLVTGEAQQGSRLAQKVCDKAIHEISVGVEMLGAYFSEKTVAVTCIGSVINSSYMKDRLTDTLDKGKNKSYTVVEPVLSAAAGGVLMALKRLDIAVNDDVIRNILKHRQSKYAE